MTLIHARQHIDGKSARAIAGRASSVAGVGFAFLVTALVMGCWPEASAVTAAAPLASPPKASDTVQVSQDQMHQLGIVKVEPYAFRTFKLAVGQIAFNEDASTVVVAPFSGRVTRLIAKIGDDVKRGDPLFEIDSPEVVQAQTDLIAAVLGVEKAKSQLNLTKRVVDRQNGLLTDRATSQREVDQAHADYAAAESDSRTAEGALTAARNRLRVIIGRDQAEVDRVERERVINPLITVNAPIDGTVIGRKVGPGQYVRSDAGDALYSIADLSTMWLKANVPEIDIPLIRVGQELEVRVTAVPDRVFKARVTVIGAASDASTRRVVVRSEIPNPDRMLKAEMFASFKIAIGDGESSPAIPVDAVIWDGNQAIVWIEQDTMVFQRRKIAVGMEQDSHLQVRDGLSIGDHVIGRGALFVNNQWQE